MLCSKRRPATEGWKPAYNRRNLATSAEMGDDVGQLDGSVEGEEIEIAFNVRYLRDALLMDRKCTWSPPTRRVSRSLLYSHTEW